MNTTDVLNRFESLPFSLEVELGGLELSVRDLLALKLGTVLQTNHPTSAPLTLRAGGTPVATGEILLVENALSVRVKEILGSSARIEQA
jgi:flagellar motor switch/type III secretory pathway protein FliN